MAEAEAGWLVCPLIKAVVDKTKACAADRFGLLNRGVPDALNQLLNELGAALHKVADAVEWSRSARGNGGGDDLDRWLLLLKDAVHEADEVVDEIEYRSLRPDGGMVSSLVKKGKQIVGADEPLNRLRAVIEKLGGIRAISGQLMKLARQEESWAGELIGPHATSVMENGEVIGRDAERKDMVSWLVNSGPPHCPHLYATDIPVAAIMGLGGVGKTTLARNLLQDYSVKAAFDLVMWVCPSAACHKVMLLKQILQSAGVQLPDSMKNFDWLQRRLEKAASSRRFLLVLDNVWNKGGMDEYMWSEVLAPLRFGHPGSKIMVTTQKRIVAKMLNASKLVILDGLAFADVWLLFTRIAFRNDSVDNYPALREIGEQLLPKLKGLPLAIKVVGGMLKGTQSIHLRYLSLCQTITRLPQSLTKLFLLQTLRVPKRCHIEEFPKDMRNLPNLRHLDMNMASTSKVVGIGELIHLQGSIEFHVKRGKGHALEDLYDMNDLCRTLRIKNLDVVASKQDACKAGLRKKHGIKVLELEWNSTGKCVPSVHAEVLEGLEPHPHVKEVRIRRYHGNTSPRWLDMNFKKDNELCLLESLYLTNCRNWEVLPSLGQLPCLKVLHLKEMSSLRQIGNEFYGTKSIAFPCLTDLEFYDMPQWVEWTKDKQNIHDFPRLRKLNIVNCPKLVIVPPLSRSIKKFSVRNTGFVSHMKLSFSSSSNDCNAELETCSTTILTDGLLQQQQVEAISVLSLRHCQGLKFEQLQALTSLKKLQISHLDITDEQLGSCLRGLEWRSCRSE